MKLNKENFSTQTDICALATTDMPGLGQFFNQADARERLDNYFAATGLSPDDPNLIFGQLIGLATLKEMIRRINEYNDGQQQSPLITGIRVYNAMSVRPYLPPPDDKAMLPDIVLLPVLADGTDIFSVHDLADPMLAVSDGMPCPNQCGTGFYLA